MKHYKCTRCGAIIRTNNCLIPTFCKAPNDYRTSGICGNGSFEELPFQPEPDINKSFAEEVERRWPDRQYFLDMVMLKNRRELYDWLKSELLKPEAPK
jgi:hypothetical protein